MSELFQDIRSGLMEAIAYERGELPDVQVRKLAVKPVPDFSSEEIKRIRLNAQMSQSAFAACIGVTGKAVEAWEGGRSHPDGAARRTIGLLRDNPCFADEAGIIVRPSRPNAETRRAMREAKDILSGQSTGKSYATAHEMIEDILR